MPVVTQTGVKVLLKYTGHNLTGQLIGATWDESKVNPTFIGEPENYPLSALQELRIQDGITVWRIDGSQVAALGKWTRD